MSYGAPEPGIVTTDNQYYTAIAAAIRQKLGTSTEYQPAQMAAAIQSIGATYGIPVTFTGNPVVATGTIANQPFEGLKIYGKSTQDGTPSPSNPIPIVSAGASGSIALSITDGADQSQSLTLSTPDGLPGIPVEYGGTFTDSTGQQYLCNEKDFTTLQNTSRLLVWTYTDQNLSKNKDIPGGVEFVVNDLDNLPPGGIKKGLCNKFVFCDGEELNSFSSGYKALWFRLPGNPTVNDAKSALNGAYFVLQRDSPLITPLSAEEIAAYNALRSYADITVISTAEPVAGMEATVYCDTAKAMDSKVSMAVNDMYADLSGAIREGVIARTAILALALTNQVLSAAGKPVIPIEDKQLETLVTTAFTVGASLLSWWKNNSFTPKAIQADNFLKKLRGE